MNEVISRYCIACNDGRPYMVVRTLRNGERIVQCQGCGRTETISQSGEAIPKRNTAWKTNRPGK